MITIEKISSSTYSKAEEFLKSVPSIEKIDNMILDNAVLALDDEKIVGCISFEEFYDKGLIRYFVFKKVLSMKYLESLLACLEDTARSKGIYMLVCVAECSQIEELFKSLDFEIIDQKNIYINEESILKTNFRSSLFLNKSLV